MFGALRSMGISGVGRTTSLRSTIVGVSLRTSVVPFVQVSVRVGSGPAGAAARERQVKRIVRRRVKVCILT